MWYSILVEHCEKAANFTEGIQECAYAHKGLGLLLRVKYERRQRSRAYLHIVLTATAFCEPRGFVLYIQVRQELTDRKDIWLREEKITGLIHA
jgi:hypothetical protein